MATKEFVPSKVNALATKPGEEAVAPPRRLPLFVPAMSAAELSAGHQPTMLAGAGEHVEAREANEAQKMNKTKPREQRGLIERAVTARRKKKPCGTPAII